jgi:hypothetical protein
VKIETTSVWNNLFFEEFLTFKNKIHKEIPTSFTETLSDYEKYFSPSSVFAEDFFWQAFMVKRDGLVVAKAILCWKAGTSKGNLGFLDWENDLEAAKFLIEHVNICAKENQLKSLKTPVDINFFIKYRIKKPGSGKPFWGEPIYPDYYHALFIKTGFGEIGRWDTYRLDILHGIKDFFLKRKQLASKEEKRISPVIRCVRMKDWDNELRIIHTLFIEAYKNMPEWEPITFEQFKTVYDDFKYIINPWYSYIVELEGKPVGFNINFADPLLILKSIQGKKLSSFDKIILFLKLRLNFSTFLITHVGKITGPNGEEIKGVQIQASKRLQFFVMFMRRVLVTFQVTNSPSRRSFETDSQTTYAQYVLYGKELAD